MYDNARVAVVVPAYNEEHQIAGVIETMPECVDTIYVANDCSTDGTAKVVADLAEKKGGGLVLVDLPENRGVGAAIEAGYRRALDDGADVIAVMAGDGQMNPDDLPSILEPVVREGVDYAKGNRLILGDVWQTIPRSRLFGNAVLSLMTKIASGYWHVADSQSGYTAIRREALEVLLKDGIYPRYGMPNDVLVKLNIHDFVVRDVPMRPVYGVGEQSKMRVPYVVLPICWLLVRLFFRRLWAKYVVRDTHPLVLFYLLGLLLAPAGVLYGVLIFLTRVVGPSVFGTDLFEVFRPIATSSGLILDALGTLSGIQMLLFAMWFDMEHNARLRG